MIRYVFKDKPNTIKGAKPADAQKIGEALAAIKQRSKGRCNSKTILDAARSRQHYLHKFFEWRDSVAAEKYRQEQARELMSCIDIVDKHEGQERRLPAFVSLIDRGGRGYFTVTEVLDSERLQSLALAQAEADFAAYEKRLSLFSEICAAIKQARALIAARRARAGAGGQRPHA